MRVRPLEPSRFFFILVVMVASQASARLPMECGPANQTGSGISGLADRACEIDFIANDCVNYLASHPEAAGKMRDCGSESSIMGDVLSGCGSGVGEAATGVKTAAVGIWSKLIHGDPQDVAEKEARDRFEKLCEADRSLKIKRQLFAEAWLEGYSDPIDDEKLRARPCRRLMSDVKARQNFAVAQELGAKLDDPQFRKDWGEARGELFDSMGQKVEALASGLNIRLNCYNRRARAAISCKILLAVAAGFATKKLKGVFEEAGVRPQEVPGDGELNAASSKPPPAPAPPPVPTAPPLVPYDFEVNPTMKRFRRPGAYGETQISVKMTIRNAEDRDVGTFLYDYFPDVEKIKVDDINITEKGKGASRAAFVEMIKRSPRVRTIETNLIEDNELAVKSFLEKGYSCRDAVMQSPAYKVRSKLGFGKIVDFGCEDDNMYLNVERQAP